MRKSKQITCFIESKSPIGLRRLSSVIVNDRRPHPLNIFFSETTGPIKVIFHTKLLWNRGKKVWSNGPSHMTKMAGMPIYGKNFKNLLLWNQKADDLETWRAALNARVLPSLFKWWPCVDLDLFYGKVKFGPLCFCRGNRYTIGFLSNCCSLWCQSW